MALKITVTIIQLISALFLILTVLFQSGSKQGLGTISGAAESFVSKTKARGIDDKLRKLTIVFSIIFVIATVAINIITLS
jgi:preprotein translocase subunit SecG